MREVVEGMRGSGMEWVSPFAIAGAVEVVEEVVGGFSSRGEEEEEGVPRGRKPGLKVTVRNVRR